MRADIARPAFRDDLEAETACWIDVRPGVHPRARAEVLAARVEMPERAVLIWWRIVPGEKAFQNGRRIAGRRLCNGNRTGDRERHDQGVEASSRLIILTDCASLRR